MVWLNIQRMVKDLPLPKKFSDGAGGIDLYSAIDTTVPFEDRKLIPTGIKVEIPRGHVGIIKSRSGNALNKLDVQAGVIDSDYRGEIKVLLENAECYGHKVIKKGDRIAQLLILESPQVIIREVEEVSVTERNENGFGSTD